MPNWNAPQAKYYLCPVCDRLFNGKRKAAKYCSDKCRQSAYRKRIDPKAGSWDNVRERARRGVNTKRNTKVVITCKHCGDERAFDQLSAILRDYCSPRCKQAAYRERKKIVTGGKCYGLVQTESNDNATR